MRGMNNVPDFFQAPAPGRYLSKCIAATGGISKSSGNEMLTLTWSIIDPQFPQYAGQQCIDNIVTDGEKKNAKGNSVSGPGAKGKLRGLGVLELFPDGNADDAMIAERLRDVELWVEYGNEPRTTQNENGEWKVPQTAIDPKTNLVIKLMKLKVVGYSRHPVGGQPQVAQTQLVQLPQQLASQPLVQLPQQFQQPMTSGFAQQPIQQFQQPVQQQPQYQQPVQQPQPQQPQYQQVQPVQYQQPQQVQPPVQLQQPQPVIQQIPVQQLPPQPPTLAQQYAQAGGQFTQPQQLRQELQSQQPQQSQQPVFGQAVVNQPGAVPGMGYAAPQQGIPQFNQPVLQQAPQQLTPQQPGDQGQVPWPANGSTEAEKPEKKPRRKMQITEVA